ncbi:short-chain dehydrogenase [Aphanothece hegewaldii CCALA 016]|uniref:Short-chain dehydrogenase n=1 Tax=Aphanothece hegewaldii CCALA 016 TaxID=2107694 RepID=A0A2T1LYT0_9CHRO|nr:type I polyketide synthase [Aphanothece hegewaldii]PSF37562.1 short-chain dehydrogenase [Aphanothece hegewaldii CCALA 016]
MTFIAIIGIGCRFPDADNPKAFWELLHNGKDTITDVPKKRWDSQQFDDLICTTKSNICQGGFLENVDQFEPEFFQISPREAEQIDPQQRLLLEVTWEALENAGLVPSQLALTKTGVYIGISHRDYLRLIEQDITRINAHSGTGTSFAIAANRISYFFNLKGPSIAIDTACSSSLVALHQACQSLILHESDFCIAGGVNLMLSPEPTIAFSQAKMMASDGRCKTFDASADGYVRGEGCGVVILKRLEDALKDGDNIQAIIRGTAINQDGLTNGLTAPNGLSQQAVIRQALHNADVLPSQISYVETHGTGTVLGDPIEIKALKAVLMEGRSLDEPCWFGSVKTNIGHLESAAGIASLIKVILSLQHREIPPHLHLKQLNPYISLENTPFAIPTQLQPWHTSHPTLFAGVSAFGFGGTNAHVILSEAPKQTTEPKLTRPCHLFTLSARSEQALQDLVKRYINYLADEPSINLANLCFTVNTGRTHFKHRLAVITQSIQQLQQQLEAYLKQEKPPRLFKGDITGKKFPKIAFLFTGQGSQYIEMGKQLYETNTIFKQTFDQCDEILKPYLEQSLKEILYTSPNSHLLNQTCYTQSALFTLEYALFQVWQSWGIQPTAVIGHSIGEYVAACIAGVFSLEDALKLIAQRAKLVQKLPQNGIMLAVVADEATVRQIIEQHSFSLDIAAVNNLKNTVISGKKEEIEAIQKVLENQDIISKPLTVSHAFHSHLMTPILEEFEQVARQVTYNKPKIALISNLTGNFATDDITTSNYWCRHLRETVRFADSIEILAKDYEIFIEIGAKPILLGMGRRCLPTHDGFWLPSLRPEQNDWQQLLESLTILYTRGISINWNKVNQDYACCRLPLPTYPFQRKRYWVVEEDSVTHVNQLNTKTSDSPISNLIQQGKTEQVLSLIQNNHQFSTEELQVLPKLLEILAQPQQHINQSFLEEWLYQIQWREKPLHNHQSLATAKTYVILADTQGIGEELAKHLQDKGNTCFLIYPEQIYQNSLKAKYNFDRFWQNITVKVDYIIHLWSLETASNENLNSELLTQAQVFTCQSLLYLIQTLPNQQSPQLWLVTKESVSINNSIPNLAQSCLWGMGKVIAWEYPQLWRGMIDLEPNSTSNVILQLIAEIESTEAENEIAFRKEKRFVSRLVKTQYPLAKTISLKSDKTYLITGGLGALGLETSQWMIKKGVRHLVLMGRNNPSTDVTKLLSQYQQQGINIQVVLGDVSKLEDVSKVFEMIKLSMPPLAGIIHAAGVLNDGILSEQNWDKFQRVMLPKVQGTWNLHQLTQEMNLDFFVVFSSLASVIGSSGQSNYAAANIFMDNLISYRNLLGLPGLSINWGLWDTVGMAASLAKNQQQRLEKTGIKSILPEQGLCILEQLLGQFSGQIGIFSINWTILQKQIQSKSINSFLSELLTLPVTENSNQPIKPRTILQTIQEAKKDEVYAILLKYFREKVSRILKLDAFHIKDDDSLNSLGFDSLMAIELRNLIIKEFNLQIAVENILEGITLTELTDLIIKQLTLAQFKESQLDGNDEEMEEIII